MLKNVLPEIKQNPSGYSNWLSLLENYRKPFYEVAVVGSEANTKAVAFRKKYLPNTLVASSIKNDTLPLLLNRFIEDETMLFVCQNYTCKLPVEKIEEAFKLIK